MSDQYVSLPRDLLLRLLSVYSTSPYPAWYELAAALEAAPAEDVRAVGEEPAGYALDSMLKRIKDNPSFGHMISGSPNGGYDTPLYRHPHRPVVLPGRKDPGNAMSEPYDPDSWNACIDEFERLNK